MWKVDPSSSMDGAEIILQGRKSARAYRNQIQEQHPPELRPQQLAERKCCGASEKEAHRGGPAHIHCPTIVAWRMNVAKENPHLESSCVERNKSISVYTKILLN